ncbi:class II histone deacetylase [Pseudomonas syringae]|uniref:class II histone deacetylase n=1 Tax=Pseudomonas syringae TaxID=317 RepID=UPI001F48ACBA|nr:class II histone deacetylase [Pseudomonas syringae]MCF5724130.1 class II histone deacetylase [Pseudomonas syringae]
MLRRTAFFFDEMTLWHSASQYALTLPVGGWVQPLASGGHAESPETKRRLKNLMDVSGVSSHLTIGTARPADEVDLLRIHPIHYLERFKSLSDSGGGHLDHRAPIGLGSYEIAKLSTGLAIAAVEAVLKGEADNAYSLSRPPGHHCLPDKAMGFCFLANIPVAIEAAKARFGLGKVAVIDWDVHHGNGTQSIYYTRPDVLTISVHQDRCFPPGYSGTGDRGEGLAIGTNINIPLLAGSGHDAYMEAMNRIVIPALERFEPELIIVACGYDANGVDPLARMLAHSETFRCMTRLVREAAERLCQGRLVLVHEGGYSEAYVPFCGLAVMEELSGHRTDVRDPLLDLISQQQPGDDQRKLQTQLIKEMANHFGLSEQAGSESNLSPLPGL